MLRKGRRGPTLRPFREWIRVTHHGCSEPLKRRIADFGSERSGRSTVEALEEHYHIEVPLYAVDKVTRETAHRAVGYNASLRPGRTAAVVQAGGVDGSMVPLTDWNSLFQGVLIGASVLAGLRGCKLIGIRFFKEFLSERRS